MQGAQQNAEIINHLVEVIQNELDQRNQLKGLDKLEILSYYLRTSSFKFKDFLSDQIITEKVNQPKQYTQYLNQLTKLHEKLNRINKGKPYTMPDIITQYNALKLAGISIGQTNCINLSKVIQALAIENDTKEIRFWGKILGMKDYYVIQGISSKKYLNDQLGPDGQPYGIGVNTYSYWVSTDILGNWIQLPLVTPSQIKQSRNFKCIFSGNLQKDLSRSKMFTGKEKHLLKCVITRITHSCQLIPKGLLKPNEQNPNVLDFQQEFKVPEIAQMNSLQNWVRLNPHILNQGRSSYYIDPKLSEQQKQALNAQLAEKDPIVQRLKGVTEDKSNEALGYNSAWLAQLCGQTIPISLVGKQEGQTAIYGVALLRNLSWPGAYTVGFKGGWTNIYIGYGHRVSQQNKIIKEVKDLAVQGQDQSQRSEPNPAKVLQPPKIQQGKPAQEGPVQ